MTTFDERETAFEARFAHDAEMLFRVEARSVKNLGLWAAHRRGASAEAAVAYARDLMAHWLSRPGLDHVFERIAADDGETGVAASPDAARAEHARLLARAKVEIMEETDRS
jgi:hypothetical protein